MLYKDKTQPIENRVRDLMSRMTLEEKTAQLSCAMLMDQENLRETIKDGIGTLSYLNASMSGDTAKDMAQLRETQRFLVEETRLGIPALIHNEGIAGLQIPGATTFQQALGIAATWEPELAEKMGETEQKQLLSFGMHALHSPLFDLGRDPRWGRISETYGEDPYLVAQMGTAYVQGLQKDDAVMATAKHFVGYGNAEGGRNGGEMQLGERSLRDTFCWPFEAAIQDAGIMAVMNGYGILNGEPIATSKAILTDLLRDDLGFKGPVVSDYGSIGRADARYRTSESQRQTAVQALQAGIDVEQPTNVCFQHLVQAVNDGELDAAYIDRALERILTVKFRLGLFENPYGIGNFEQETARPEADALSLEIAEKSIVLLKNEENILPLRSGLKVALIGPSADAKAIMFGGYSSVGSVGTTNRDFDQTENDKFLTMAYQAAITEFKDSIKQQLGMEFDDQPSPEQKEIILSILKQNFTSSNTVYSSQADFMERYYPHCRSVREALEAELGTEQVRYAAGCGIKESIPGGIEEALRCVEDADIVIAVLGGLESMVDEGATCGENRDNTNTDLERAQLELMEAVFATGKPVVSVLIDGRPLSVSSVSKNSKALLHAWLPAEHGGEAIANILTGKRSPCGKLPVTMVRSAAQIPMHYDRLQLFTEPEVWAEYVDDEQNHPLYPFGHGLSYTQFTYEDLSVDKTVNIRETVNLRFTVRNTGKCAGNEVAQIYIRDMISSVARPCLQLAAFAKVPLMPGEAKNVSVELDLRQLAFHDSRMQLVVEPGEMELLVGASSADIRLRDSFTITGDTLPVKQRIHRAKVSIQ
ncbi:MAG: glycoside hydrolase family 3 C-terminal domain-containing protein [bacterium]|nr:glycoside hydrolase family 3 C-terminal domain-containing protein [bacterium]MCM1423443.1 glycoside hydrolase family 3 C-terminal domain-containing protein [bacterium]